MVKLMVKLMVYPGGRWTILSQTKIRLKKSDKVVYRTSSLISLGEDMLCSKLHWQKRFNLILLSYKIDGQSDGERWGQMDLPGLLHRTIFMSNIKVSV